MAATLSSAQYNTIQGHVRFRMVTFCPVLVCHTLFLHDLSIEISAVLSSPKHAETSADDSFARDFAESLQHVRPCIL